MRHSHDAALKGVPLRARRDQHAPLSCVRRSAQARREQVSLAETLDRVLHKGAVIAGDITISVADIDLVYLGLNLVVTSVETMQRWAQASRVEKHTGSRQESTEDDDALR